MKQNISFDQYIGLFQDLLGSLTLSIPAHSVKPQLDQEARRKFRGLRQMSQIVVETFSDFENVSFAAAVMNSEDKNEKFPSKESSPGTI
jgi:hypothetical protein